MKNKYSIVEVEWRDSMSGRGWRTQEEANELFDTDPVIRSVGYLYREDKQKIALVGCVDHQETPNVNRYHEIPRAMVKSMRKLK